MLDIGMDVQMGLPTGGALREFARRYADLGLDHVAVGDHVSFRDGGGFDGLVNAMALLASDERLRVNIGVYLLPLRHPTVVARQVATIAEQAPGRLVFGVGLGGDDRHEYAVCGLEARTRGTRMDECLEVLQGLLAGRSVDFEGRHFRVTGARVLPTPQEAVPVIIGGRSPASYARTAKYGDGWLGLWTTPERFAESVARIDAEATAQGRRVEQWQHGMKLWCGFDHAGRRGVDNIGPVVTDFYGVPFEKFERYTPMGTPEAVAEHASRFVDAGAHSLSIIAAGVPLEAGMEYVAQVREHLVGQHPHLVTQP